MNEEECTVYPSCTALEEDCYNSLMYKKTDQGRDSSWTNCNPENTNMMPYPNGWFLFKPKMRLKEVQ